MEEKKTFNVVFYERLVKAYLIPEGWKGQLEHVDPATHKVQMEDGIRLFDMYRSRICLPAGKILPKYDVEHLENGMNDRRIYYLIETYAIKRQIEAATLREAVRKGQELVERDRTDYEQEGEYEAETQSDFGISDTLIYTARTAADGRTLQPIAKSVMYLYGDQLADRMAKYYLMDRENVTKLPVFRETIACRAELEMLRRGCSLENELTIRLPQWETPRDAYRMEQDLVIAAHIRHARVYDDGVNAEIDLTEDTPDIEVKQILDYLEQFVTKNYLVQGRKERPALSLLYNWGRPVAAYLLEKGDHTRFPYTKGMYRYTLQRDKDGGLTARTGGEEGPEGTLYTFFPLSGKNGTCEIESQRDMDDALSIGQTYTDTQGRKVFLATEMDERYTEGTLTREDSLRYAVLTEGMSDASIRDIQKAFLVRLFPEKYNREEDREMAHTFTR